MNDAAFPAAIQRAIVSAGASPIVWGRSDCLMWIADIYRGVLGTDPAAPYRGRYTTRRGAIRVLKRVGVGDVEGALVDCADRMSWCAIEPGAAVTGDLGLVDTIEGPAGVICDREFWCGRVDNGFSGWRTPCVRRAWSVA